MVNGVGTLSAVATGKTVPTKDSASGDRNLLGIWNSHISLKQNHSWEFVFLFGTVNYSRFSTGQYCGFLIQHKNQRSLEGNNCQRLIASVQDECAQFLLLLGFYLHGLQVFWKHRRNKKRVAKSDAQGFPGGTYGEYELMDPVASLGVLSYQQHHTSPTKT